MRLSAALAPEQTLFPPCNVQQWALRSGVLRQPRYIFLSRQVARFGSIDVSKRHRKKRRKVKDGEYQTDKRQANDVKPREKWLAEHTTKTEKPWLALKISKATHYRQGLNLTVAVGQVPDETGLAMKVVSNTCDTLVSPSELKRRDRTQQDMNWANLPTATEWRAAA